MLKEKAVASLGQQSLLMPAWIKSALRANDRLKLLLTVLQSAVRHAELPESAQLDMTNDIVGAGFSDVDWLADLAKGAYFDEDQLIVPALTRLSKALSDDLDLMARPIVAGTEPADAVLKERCQLWHERLRELATSEALSRATLHDLTHGDRRQADGFHILVMDLHKRINVVAQTISTEIIDGAHAWSLGPDDRPLIQAFMRGLNRTAPLKFSHPGLDTAATRDGRRLLIQNDIGTNDAHVLVIEVHERTIELTYSELHKARFSFFNQMLEGLGFTWSIHDPVATSELNAGKPYHVGKAIFNAQDDAQLQKGLEDVGSRIVFVIDWNRARKRLQLFVSKTRAIELLRQGAAREYGHMAWLQAGGERLVFSAMQSVNVGTFRAGDRLDEILGEQAAQSFLADLMRVSSEMLLQKLPINLIADEARMLLIRALRQRTFEFDLLADHAAYCHALAELLAQRLESVRPATQPEYAFLTARAAEWEHRADQLLTEARQRFERHDRWQPIVELLTRSDDVADALEEAVFILSMIHDKPLMGLPQPVVETLAQLSNATLSAIQDFVKAIQIARQISSGDSPGDNEEFLRILWQMIRAERRCDELFREARIVILQSLYDKPAAFGLTNELAATLESATDALLEVGHLLRKMIFQKTAISI